MLLLAPNAQIHLVPPGTSILLKLHSEVKYLGSNLLEAGPKKSVAEDTNEDILFLEESSEAKIWIVPWLEDAQTKLESGLEKKEKKEVISFHVNWFHEKIHLSIYLKLIE